MNRTQLLQHFDTLAETPGAVAKLRDFVLHLATRGRLVPQNPADEPASELATRVRAAAKRIATAKRLKLPTPEVGMTDGDLTFPLPKGWAWVKLGDLCLKLGAGSTPLGGKRIYEREGVMFLRSQNVWNDGLRLDDVALIPPSVHEDMKPTRVEPGDVLLNITGASIGRSAIVPDEFGEANVSQCRLSGWPTRHFVTLSTSPSLLPISSPASCRCRWGFPVRG
jgi:type I restriction enzyme S subunit